MRGIWVFDGRRPRRSDSAAPPAPFRAANVLLPDEPTPTPPGHR
ncbi:hypothetical protein O7626_00710 [Micromonospora sp. WMMD1102]|nr:hypothetical protein [Micromonospora sp. WMMD1102]MDG4784468.1 hypothetical protein [Micromonospora sp. WMMD1102]